METQEQNLAQVATAFDKYFTSGTLPQPTNSVEVQVYSYIAQARQMSAKN